MDHVLLTPALMDDDDFDVRGDGTRKTQAQHLLKSSEEENEESALIPQQPSEDQHEM